MNGLPRHPGTDELAEFRCGITDGARGDQLAAHIAECPDCASVSDQLGYIPVLLAAIPQPAMPADLDTRIMAAIAAERPRRDWRSSRLTAPLGVLAAAAACLLLAFMGLHLSGQSHSGASASSAARGTPIRSGDASAGGVAGPRQNSLSPSFSHSASFPVLISATDFQSATLQAQVMHQLALLGKARGGQTGSTGQSSPGLSSGPAAGVRIPPPQSLIGCVARLTGRARPVLVEEANYQSRPAYVIATPTRAWVVARDCTSSHRAVFASVALSPTR